MLRLVRRSLVLAAFATAFALPRLAFAAGNAEACIAASEHAQEFRNAGKLTAARDQLMICSRAECPKIVQSDCTKWMGEVLAALPSVVPAAKDPNGRDVVEAKFSIDGKLVIESLDGKPVPVDTGVHVFRLEAPGMKPVEERVVIRSGEQNRVVTWKLEPAPKAPTPPPAQQPPPAPPPPVEVERVPPEKKSSLPILPIALGAAGIFLMGVGLYLDLGATSSAHDLRSKCAPNCNQKDVDDIQTRYTIAGVTAGVGAAVLIAGGVLFFTTRKSSDTGLTIAPLMTGGAVAQGRISF